MTPHVTLEEIAQVPQERRNYGWVVVTMVRRTGRGRRSWEPLHVIGFYDAETAIAIAADPSSRRAGYKSFACPFDDGNPVGIPAPFKPS